MPHQQQQQQQQLPTPPPQQPLPMVPLSEELPILLQTLAGALLQLPEVGKYLTENKLTEENLITRESNSMTLTPIAQSIVAMYTQK